MKKIVLVSMGVLLTVMPAMATPSHTSNSFPNDEYMLEDYTYTNQATYANMGVYSDSVNVTADYTNNEYNVVAGTYLPAASETVTQCPANSFCPGLTGPTYYDATNAQGATACSTLTGGFNSSAAGASAETDCYKACTTTNVAHSTAVTGNDYYGAGADTCYATGCENGYHTESTDLSATIGNVSGSYGYINPSGASSDASTYGLTENGTFAVAYENDKGTLTGRAQCSTQSGTGMWTDPAATTASEITTRATLPDSTGLYCYCTLDSYTPVGGTTKNLSGPWVFNVSFAVASFCANFCASQCSAYLRNTDTSYLTFRSAVFGAFQSLATCVANTITINWTDVDPEYAGDNDEGTVTFGGDIRTPRAAVSKPGKIFVGWKFVKPSGN